MEPSDEVTERLTLVRLLVGLSGLPSLSFVRCRPSYQSPLRRTGFSHVDFRQRNNLRGEVMKGAMLSVIVFALVAVSSASAARWPDPRVCPGKARAADTPKSCAYLASVNAVKKLLGAHMQQGLFDGDISCIQASPSLLVFRCSWKGGPIVGHGVIRFNRLTFQPTLTVVANVCTQPITGDIVWHGCTKILPPPPH